MNTQDSDTIKILFIGDIIGNPGRKAIFLKLPELTRDGVDITIVNGENAAGGFGITPKICGKFFRYGIDVITTGNHIWRNNEIFKEIDQIEHLIRPANFPPGTPGRGYIIYETRSRKIPVCIINLMGRINISDLDCPFRKADEIIDKVKDKARVIIVDFHAETTSEKVAFGHYLNGKVSAVLGTHTHIQTADNKILSGGTAYITDTGMTGPSDSVIGMNKELVLKHFLTQMPFKFTIAKGDIQINGVVIEVDIKTGNAVSINRINQIIEEDTIDEDLR